MKNTTFFTADNVKMKNFKGIKDFQGRLNGACAIIIGSEAAGKTNFLQAIQMVYGKYPSAVLTKDEEEGLVKIEISRGETKYLFKFKFDNEGERPKMTTYVDGEKITIAKQADVVKALTPKTFDLDKLLGSTGQAQADMILTAFGIDVSKEKETYSEAFNERKLAKRSLEECSHFEVREKIEKVDTKVLLEEKKKYDDSNTKKRLEYEEARENELKEISIFNSKQDALASQMQESVNGLKILRERRDELEEELKRLGERIQKGKEHIDGLPKAKKRKELVSSIKQPIYASTEEFETKIINAENTNQKASEYDEYQQKLKVKEQKVKNVDSWETKVRELAKAIVNKINSAKLAIEGLELKTKISDSSGRISSSLMYKDLPFDTESINTGERIAIAAKLQMSLFEEGDLAIISLNAGSVGDETIKKISDECRKLGMQVLFELTSRGDSKELQIETILEE